MTSRPRLGAMLLLSGCFVFSAAFRTVEPAAAALAAGAGDGETISADARVMEQLIQRADALDAREAALAERSATLAEAETRLRAQLAELEEMETRLAALVEVASSAAEADVAKLVAAYQAMDGKRAAAIFETMDVAFAAGLIALMRDEPAADILSALPPERAYAITAHIAGRNAKIDAN